MASVGVARGDPGWAAGQQHKTNLPTRFQAFRLSTRNALFLALRGRVSSVLSW
jgi:hypothetical protein